MTVAKIFTGKALKKGNTYRRADLFDTLQGFENMASTYFDPTSDQLYTFFNADSKDWKNINVPHKSEFHFHHRREPKLTESPKWEQSKIRHIFYRSRANQSGTFEYIGSTTGKDKYITNSAGFMVRVLPIK